MYPTIDEFFEELAQRMNMPDDDNDGGEYSARLCDNPTRPAPVDQPVSGEAADVQGGRDSSPSDRTTANQTVNDLKRKVPHDDDLPAEWRDKRIRLSPGDPSSNDTAHGPALGPSDNADTAPLIGRADPLVSGSMGAGVKQSAASGKELHVVEQKTSTHSAKTKRPAVQKVLPSPVELPKGHNAASKATKKEKANSKGSKSSNEKETPQYLPISYWKVSPSLTPAEYVKHIEGRVRLEANPYLTGCHIYYYGQDFNLATETTRARMLQLARLGATLAPTLDPRDKNITQIVVNDSIANLTLFKRKHGLRSLKQIPGRIPILKWAWAASNNTKSHYRNFAVFDRKHSVDALDYIEGVTELRDPYKDDGEQGQGPSDVNSSNSYNRRIASGSIGLDCKGKEQTPPGNSNDTFGKTDPAKVKEDPLTEFYGAARAQQEEEQCQVDKDYSAVSWRPVVDEKQIPKQLSKFICDNPRTVPPGENPNQDVIDKLKELKKCHENQLGSDHRWRVLTYSKVIPALEAYKHKRIETIEEAKSLRGAGEKTAQKIMEIIQTGDLRRLHHEQSASPKVIQLFQGIYGVGIHTAHRWYMAGCRTLRDLEKGVGGVKLTSVQKIGLRYYRDINSRMPREEAEEIFVKIERIALEIDPKLFIRIMGSFRRGKPDCGDIDILITRPTEDEKTHGGIFKMLIDELRIRGIIMEDLSVPEDYSDLELVYRGLCRRDRTSRRRRIDFLCVPYKSRGAALLYYTGDDIFNRSMRLKANKMGYSLNQRGLYAGVVRDPQDRRKKLNEGTIIASETEEEIFKKLDIPWQEPHQRVRG